MALLTLNDRCWTWDYCFLKTSGQESGVGASGTRRNFEKLGTAGYRVPGKFQKLGTAGYRVPSKFWNLGTARYRVPSKFWKLGTDGYRVPARKKKFWVPMGTGYRENFHLCRPLVKSFNVRLKLIYFSNGRNLHSNNLDDLKWPRVVPTDLEGMFLKTLGQELQFEVNLDDFNDVKNSSSNNHNELKWPRVTWSDLKWNFGQKIYFEHMILLIDQKISLNLNNRST